MSLIAVGTEVGRQVGGERRDDSTRADLRAFAENMDLREMDVRWTFRGVTGWRGEMKGRGSLDSKDI